MTGLLFPQATPMGNAMNENKLIISNTDTGLLKIIAVVSMLIDHVGAVLFPSAIFLRIIGRIAFPIFAYCLVFGFFHTKNIKSYFIRLFIFALISQPAFLYAFYGRYFWYSVPPGAGVKTIFSLYTLNIFFTLFLGLLFIYGLKEKKYLLSLIALVIPLFVTVDYGIYGVLLIGFIYLLCKTDKTIMLTGMALFLAIYFFIPPASIRFLGVPLNIQGFAFLSIIPIAISIKTKLHMPKYFYYIFYPLHLLLLGIIRDYFPIY